MQDRTEQPRPLARRRFGQHFLEPVWARKVVAAINPQPDEAFMEIGPGRGAITRPLAEAAGSLLACEIDRDLALALRAEQLPRVRILEGDFLKLSFEQLREELQASAPAATCYRIAGNLPYNVASPIMFRLVELSRLGLAFRDATVMLQREVADRLVAEPGTRDYGVLAVLLGHRASVDRVVNLPPGAFRPAPKVRSAVVRLRFHPPDPPVLSEATFGAVTNAVFSRRRKTMGNALLAYGGVTSGTSAGLLAAAGIDPARRPETLSIVELARVADAVARRPAASTTGPAPAPVL